MVGSAGQDAVHTGEVCWESLPVRGAFIAMLVVELSDLSYAMLVAGHGALQSTRMSKLASTEKAAETPFMRPTHIKWRRLYEHP